MVFDKPKCSHSLMIISLLFRFMDDLQSEVLELEVIILIVVMIASSSHFSDVIYIINLCVKRIKQFK